MSSNLDAAWKALHAATPPGWCVGSPMPHPERHAWEMYAFDPSERAIAGLRIGEWTAMAQSEEAEIRKLARCLSELSAGRVPK